MKRLTIALCILVLISCQDKSRKEVDIEAQNDTSINSKIDKTLKVTINAKVLVDDVFEVYYYEFGEKTFHPDDFVSSVVIGDTISQDIIFNLPKKSYPERLRLDFGKTPRQKEIQLNGVSISYGDKVYYFTKDEIDNEFKPSKFMDFNTTTNVIKTQQIDGKYDPYFYTKKVSNIVNYLLED